MSRVLGRDGVGTGGAGALALVLPVQVGDAPGEVARAARLPVHCLGDGWGVLDHLGLATHEWGELVGVARTRLGHLEVSTAWARRTELEGGGRLGNASGFVNRARREVGLELDGVCVIGDGLGRHAVDWWLHVVVHEGVLRTTGWSQSKARGRVHNSGLSTLSKNVFFSVNMHAQDMHQSLRQILGVELLFDRLGCLDAPEDLVRVRHASDNFSQHRHPVKVEHADEWVAVDVYVGIVRVDNAQDEGLRWHGRAWIFLKLKAGVASLRFQGGLDVGIPDVESPTTRSSCIIPPRPVQPHVVKLVPQVFRVSEAQLGPDPSYPLDGAVLETKAPCGCRWVELEVPRDVLAIPGVTQTWGVGVDVDMCGHCHLAEGYRAWNRVECPDLLEGLRAEFNIVVCGSGVLEIDNGKEGAAEPGQNARNYLSSAHTTKNVPLGDVPWQWTDNHDPPVLASLHLVVLAGWRLGTRAAGTINEAVGMVRQHNLRRLGSGNCNCIWGGIRLSVTLHRRRLGGAGGSRAEGNEIFAGVRHGDCRSVVRSV